MSVIHTIFTQGRNILLTHLVPWTEILVPIFLFVGPSQIETSFCRNVRWLRQAQDFASKQTLTWTTWALPLVWHCRFSARMGSGIIFYICRCANFMLIKSYMYYLLLRCDVKVESLEHAVKLFVQISSLLEIS